MEGQAKTPKSTSKFPDPEIDDDFILDTPKNFIFLVLDCYSYISGENVTGEILINIVKSLPNASLKFIARGIEAVHVFDKTLKTNIIVEDRAEIFNLEEICQNWDDELQPGHYVFPFNFKIPQYAPSTFYYSGEDDLGYYVKAEVFYHISAKLFTENKDVGIVHSRIVTVKNRDCLSKPMSLIEKSAVVPSCCFKSRGTTGLKLYLNNKDHCSVDGEVKFNLDPDNSWCTVPINHVTALVVLDVIVTTHKGDFKSRRILSTTERAAWINAHSNRVYEKDFDYTVELKVSSEELNPSSNSTPLINCQYYVEMQLYYDVIFNKSPVVMRMTFHVNPAINYRKEEAKLPIDWDPAESPITNFIVETKNILYIEKERKDSCLYNQQLM